MALYSVLPSVLSASPLLANLALPTAIYGSRILARHMSSFVQATAPQPEVCSEPEERDLTSTSWDCTFGPLAKHLLETRQYNRVMPHEAHFVSPAAHSCSTLLGLHRRPGDRFDMSAGRRSDITDLVERHVNLVGIRTMHTAPSLNAEGVLPQQVGAVTQWVNKVQPRMKGGVRKLVLRQINRKIVARLARRFTIGIPVVGFYFVSKLLTKDCQRVAAEFRNGEYAVSSLFATAVVADILDLAAQGTIIAGFAHTNFNMGLATAAALLLHADMASLACAALSFASAVSAEMLSMRRSAQLEGNLSE